MRVTFEELVKDTNNNTPKGQADWFRKHFDVTVEYDSNGVIITRDVFNAIVAKKYDVAISNRSENPKVRPQVKLLASKGKARSGG